MEALSVLEKKIVELIKLVTKLREENAMLSKENVRLANELKTLNKSVSHGTQNIEKLSQEQNAIKMAVSSLIKDIDVLVENDQ